MGTIRLIVWLFSTFFFLAIVGAGVAIYGYWHFSEGLPDYTQLADYDPPTVTRVHAGDGRLVAEYAVEKRVYVPINAIPQRVIRAFLAAEDKNFYTHPGIDVTGVVRAIIQNVRNYLKDRRLVGASTITQQVAKNFLLTNEVSIDRKIREAILAFRIEKAFTKDRILELYLNEIYLGAGSYGVAAAALNYFNKSLDELSIAEAAYLAALPKAPSNYHPTRQREAAIARRNWVVDRMEEEGYVTDAEAEAAKADELDTFTRDDTEFFEATYFAEEVRRELYDRFGESGLYGGGLSVHTTLDPNLQRAAEIALRDGLIAYDRRHGWRGPLGQIDISGDWLTALGEFEPPPGLAPWRLAVVLEVSDKSAEIGFADAARGKIPLGELKWARETLDDQKLGGEISRAGQVLSAGDVVAVEELSTDEDGKELPAGTFGLRQIPNVNGAIVALDPHTGRILAMSGGWSYEQSEFNRATQAWRQPGSAFKPFVYLTALDNGFTPAHLVLDAPFVIDQGGDLGKWKPANYSDKFYGPSPLRLGIEKSRNLMTVRLAQYVGMDKVKQTAEAFGIVDSLEPVLAMALGSGETTLLRLTAAYAMLVNGGYKIRPTFIDRIQDKSGQTIFQHDQRPCDACRDVAWEDQPVPEVPDGRERIADAASAYQVVSMLEGVVLRGTGTRVRPVGKPVGGKTGTTNDSFDSWFMGFSPDLAAGVFVGFDEPRTLGARETGSSAAAPIFRDFMMAALADKPAVPFRIPPGIRLVNVNKTTGEPARAGDPDAILEAFKPGTEPTGRLPVLGGGEVADEGTDTVPAAIVPGNAPTGTGGLY